MSHGKDEQSNTEGVIQKFRAIVVVLCAIALGYFVYSTTINHDSQYPFKLDSTSQGSHLVYEADVTSLDATEVPDLMNVLREVIERRINVFGVSEPVVQVERSSLVANTKSERLVVELPGVADVEEAVKEIGKTPLLEFKLIDPETEAKQASIQKQLTMRRQMGKRLILKHSD